MGMAWDRASIAMTIAMATAITISIYIHKFYI